MSLERERSIRVEYRGKPLGYTVYHRQVHQAAETPSKLLDAALAEKRSPKRRRTQPAPSINHPWKRFPVCPEATH